MLVELFVFPLLFPLSSSCEAGEPDDLVMFNRSKMLSLVNKARHSGHYCGKKWYSQAGDLKWNDQLATAAKVHSTDMSENNFISHKGSNGQFVGDRIFTQRYIWTDCAENLAYGILYEEDVVKEWLKSPGHCENIMNPVYTDMGACLIGKYWTQVFAKPQN